MPRPLWFDDFPEGEFEGEAVMLGRPGAEVCDFCSRPLAPADCWTFRAEPHEIMRVIADRPFVPPDAIEIKKPEPAEGEPWTTHHMDADGMWGACEGCKDLIEAGDRRGLLARAMSGPPVAAVESVAERMFARGLIARAHRSFFDHRLPDPPFRGTPDRPAP